MKTWRIAFIILLVASAFSCAFADNPIQIGVVLPFSGDGAFWATHSKNGILLALEDLNSKKDAAPVEALFEDSKCEPKSGVNAFQKLTALQGVKMVVGDICSSVTLSMAPIAEKRHILLITPGSAAPGISDAGKFIYRTWSPSTRQANALAEFSVARLKASRIAVINLENDYGEPFAVNFIQKLSSLGVAPVVKETYGADVSDLKPQLTRIKAAKPDLLVMIGYLKDGRLVVKQARELGISAQIIGTEGLASDSDFIKPLGSLAEGIIFSDYKDSTTKEFIERYSKVYNMEWPGQSSTAAVSYDAFYLMGLAARATGSDTEKMTHWLDAQKDFPGASGKLTFDANGDIPRTVGIFQIRNGKPVEY
jgi:branched-chain amino acid transport system substrate-binding protein